MSDVTYLLDQAEQSLHADGTQATLDLCQTVLRDYPRCLRACRLAGAALWAQGQAAAAVRLFTTVLNGDPEDVIARYGLSRALEESDLDAAVAEMEIAFALAPGNLEIRQTLQRLYQARGKTVDIPLKLTRDALARTHARGALWSRAVAETRQLLAAQPSRLDLRVLLAEVLWRSGDLPQSAVAWQEILTAWPYCLKANLVLGHIWDGEGKKEAAGALFRKARELDPEDRMAGELAIALA
jgi:tetratricopeptide (TPR) repeat protein